MTIKTRLGWVFVFMQNMPLLINHIVSYVFGKPVVPGALRISGYRFWVRNINTIGILQKAMLETQGIRGKVYTEVDAFIDVGGHAGAKAFAAKYVNPSLQVFLFEPNPLNVELLKSTFKGVRNVEIVEVGIGDESCTQKLYFDPDHLDTASLNPKHYFLNKNTRRELIEKDVRIIPLDAHFSGTVPFRHGYLKIDVESTEAAVLDGAIETLKRCAYLEIEISQGASQNTSDILTKLMREFDFDILDCEFIGTDEEGTPRAVNLLLKRKSALL